jgi:hypothetical protein
MERLLDFATRSRWGKRPIARADAGVAWGASQPIARVDAGVA